MDEKETHLKELSFLSIQLKIIPDDKVMESALYGELYQKYTTHKNEAEFLRSQIDLKMKEATEVELARHEVTRVTQVRKVGYENGLIFSDFSHFPFSLSNFIPFFPTFTPHTSITKN